MAGRLWERVQENQGILSESIPVTKEVLNTAKQKTSREKLLPCLNYATISNALFGEVSDSPVAGNRKPAVLK